LKRRFENYYSSVVGKFNLFNLKIVKFEFYSFDNFSYYVGYLMFCIPAFYVLKVFYTNVQWARKKKQIDQLREKLGKVTHILYNRLRKTVSESFLSPLKLKNWNKIVHSMLQVSRSVQQEDPKFNHRHDLQEI
jgi:hypothetical protein